MRTLLLVLLATVAVTACKKEDDQGKQVPPVAAKKLDAGAAKSAAAPDAGVEPMAKKAGNCPSTVVGATTAIDDAASTGGKVVVAITAKEAGAVPTIRARAKHLVEVQNAPAADVAHTGEGTGGGDGGVCPVIARGNKLEAADIDSGVKVTMTPATANPKLRELVEARIGEAKAWTEANIKQTGESGGLGGDGGGKGGHGGNRAGKGDASGPRDAGAAPAPDEPAEPAEPE